MNKNRDTYPRNKNDTQSGQFVNQMTITVAGARETVGNQVVQKPKRVKDYTYHKEKMMLCKQEEKDAPLSTDQGDWLVDTDEEPDEQELEAHYMYMAKIQKHSEQPESINDTYVVENVDSNVIPDSSDACDNEGKADQNAKEYEDERVVLANVMTNLKFDTDENTKIQKQLKKKNTLFAHELREFKSALEESNDTRDRCISALHHQEIKLEKYKSYKDWTIEKYKVEHKLKETLGLLAQQESDSKEALKTKGHENFLVKEKNVELVKQSSLKHTRYERLLKEKDKLKQDFNLKKKTDIDKLIALENQIPYDKDDLANIFAPNQEETLTLKQESRSKLDKEKINQYDYTYQNTWEKLIDNEWQQPTIQEITVLVKNILIPLAIKSRDDAFEFENTLKQEMFEDLEYVKSLEKEVDELESEKTDFSNEFDLLLQEFFSKDIMCYILCSFESLDEHIDL
ncbi:hypothetical protein Tco_0920116 [Tanacetum coccineum]